MRRIVIGFILVLVLTSGARVAQAAPITLDFTADVTFAGGVLSGVGPTVSGTYVYDTDFLPVFVDPLGKSADYVFTGHPYGFYIDIDNGGTISDSESRVSIRNDDFIAIPGGDRVLFVGAEYSGPNAGLAAILRFVDPSASSFDDINIPMAPIILGMVGFLEVKDIQSNATLLFADVKSASINPVPEPSTLLLLGTGLLGAGVMARRRRRQ